MPYGIAGSGKVFVVVWNPEEMTVIGSFATGLGIEAPNDSRV